MSKDRFVCRRCNVEAEVILKKDKPHQVVCPSCGAVENFEVAKITIAREHVEDLLFTGLKIVKNRRKPTSKFCVG